MFQRKKMIYTIAVLLALTLAVVGYLNLPKFGRHTRGARLSRIEQSPNYRNGKFQNIEPTPQLTSDKNRARIMYDFLFEKREHNRPTSPIPAIKTNLQTLNRDEELLVWFGHSSYFIQSSGVRMLVDPVFEEASPVSFLNKPFAGTDIYKAEDMPAIDYLIITHDHWDHLDHKTVTALRTQVQHVVCPLGVGEHLEYWGYTPEQIIEMDWSEQYQANSPLMIYCLPARHFSGRTLRSNQTLWASYMVITPTQTIYLSGDGGYGAHFRQIAEQFPQIDLAVMENGQYNQDWRHIHLLPEGLTKAIDDLHPRRVMTGHNSKYALAKHPWKAPLEHATTIPTALTPDIGEIVHLQDTTITKKQWWNAIN